jgi:hypothetical protein
MNTPEMQICPESKCWCRIRMSRSKGFGNVQNNRRKLFRVTTEYKSIEVMNTQKMHSRQQSMVYNEVQTALKKLNGSN